MKKSKTWKPTTERNRPTKDVSVLSSVARADDGVPDIHVGGAVVEVVTADVPDVHVHF